MTPAGALLLARGGWLAALMLLVAAASAPIGSRSAAALLARTGARVSATGLVFAVALALLLLFAGWLGRMQAWKAGWQGERIVPRAYAAGELLWCACLTAAALLAGWVAHGVAGRTGWAAALVPGLLLLAGSLPGGRALAAHPPELGIPQAGGRPR